MRKSLLALAASGVCLLPLSAKADTFNFSVSLLGTSTSGTLTATNNNDGSFTVNGITAPGITALVAPTDPLLGNDNLLFPGNARLVDVNGLGFDATLGGTAYAVDLISTLSGFQVVAFDPDGIPNFGDVTFSVNSPASVTPEPSSLILLVTGALGLGALAARRRQHVL